MATEWVCGYVLEFTENTKPGTVAGQPIRT